MKILLAYDNSRNAKMALAQAITMFQPLKPEINLIAVVETPLDTSGEIERLYDEERQHLETGLAEASVICHEHGLVSKSFLTDGDARKTILRATEKLLPDMLIIARHSEQPDGGFLARSLTQFVDELDYMTFGSVSSFLARRAECPVLILPSH